MAQKRQRRGGQILWNIEDLSDGMRLFYERYNHYPTSQEVDAFEFLPSARSIQRRFGGLIELRQTLGLGGQIDYTKGAHSSDRAKKIGKRSHELEKEAYDFLTGIFGVEFIHREYFFTDDRRTRADFLVYYDGGGFSVDVFYPKNRHNLIGCLNSKLRKYANNLMLQYPVIFVQMNKNITREEVEDILSKKKNKLKNYQSVMCYEGFKDFCHTKNPRI